MIIIIKNDIDEYRLMLAVLCTISGSNKNSTLCFPSGTSIPLNR